MMRRRSLLAGALTGVAGLVAGCADPAGSLQLTDAEGVRLAEEASASVDDPTGERERLVSGAVGNGSATVNDTHAPFEPDRPVAYDGAYYNLSWTATAERERRVYPIEIDYNPTDTAGDAIAVADLPAVDRRALRDAVPPPMEEFQDGTDFGVTHHYDAAAREASVLVPEQEYAFVTYEGERYRLETQDARTRTERTYRYTAAEVAPDAETYVAQLRERYRFRLTGLSTAERKVIEEAIDGGYYAESTGDEAFRSVLDRFRNERAVTRTEYEGEWVIAYEGTTYWAEVRFGQFVE
jgi:hypothetical protein